MIKFKIRDIVLKRGVVLFSKYFPGEYAVSVFDLDYSKLYQKGYRGIIFDIDNTLVPHGDDSTPEVDALFDEIHAAGLKTLLLSNNDTERIECFLKNIDSLYIPDADKPDTDGYLRAVEALGLRKSQVVFVGDQTFTDIIGANNAGIDCILVRYIGYGIETKIGIKRRLEKLVLSLYAIKKSAQHKFGDIFKEGKKSALEQG